MARDIQFKRGNSVNFDSVELLAGEPAFLLDTGELFIGDGTNKIRISLSDNEVNLLIDTALNNFVDNDLQTIISSKIDDFVSTELQGIIESKTNEILDNFINTELQGIIEAKVNEVLNSFIATELVSIIETQINTFATTSLIDIVDARIDLKCDCGGTTTYTYYLLTNGNLDSPSLLFVDGDILVNVDDSIVDYDTPITNGSSDLPELIFVDGDVLMSGPNYEFEYITNGNSNNPELLFVNGDILEMEVA